MSSVTGPQPWGLSSGPGEVQKIIDALAKRLDRAVAIDDPRLRLIVHTAHAHKVDRHRITSILTRRATDESAQHSFRQGIADATGTGARAVGARDGAFGPVLPEYSIERLTCAIASRPDAVMVG